MVLWRDTAILSQNAKKQVPLCYGAASNITLQENVLGAEGLFFKCKSHGLEEIVEASNSYNTTRPRSSCYENLFFAIPQLKGRVAEKTI